MFSKLEWESVFDKNYIFKDKVFYYVLGIKLSFVILKILKFYYKLSCILNIDSNS